MLQIFLVFKINSKSCKHYYAEFELLVKGRAIWGWVIESLYLDFKPSRPFRIVTGSEDNTAAVYEGPPFKFKCTKTDHTRYCQVNWTKGEETYFGLTFIENFLGIFSS